MNPILIGLVDWRLPYSGYKAVRLSKELGVDAIQLDLGGPNRAPWLDEPHNLRLLKNTLIDSNITPLAIAANVINDIGLTAEVGSASYFQVKKIVIRALDIAEKIGANLVIIPSFRLSAINNLLSFYRTAEILQWACSEAKDRELFIATENILLPKQLMLLISLVNSSNLRIILDTGNLALAGVNPISIINIASHILSGQIHIKNSINTNSLNTNNSDVSCPLLELNNLQLKIESLVLENDYRDGDIERIKSDINWLKSFYKD